MGQEGVVFGFCLSEEQAVKRIFVTVFICMGYVELRSFQNNVMLSAKISAKRLAVFPDSVLHCFNAF